MSKHTSAGFDGFKPNSSQVAFCGYCPKTKVLRVEFNSGGAYHYHDVPKSAWQGMEKATSVGSHMHQHIKGQYRAEKKG